MPRTDVSTTSSDSPETVLRDPTDDYDLTRFWSGLAILERLSETGTELTSEEAAALLGTRSVKGIGAALSGTRLSLGEAGIRLDEAVRHLVPEFGARSEGAARFRDQSQP